jgi:hypothetical protein
MHLRSFLGGLFLITVLPLSPTRAQTDHPSPTTQVTRAVAVYEWTGDLAHPTAARLIPVSLFINAHLEDAGIYLAQPIPFALQPGTLYLLQRAGQTGVETSGAFDIQSAHTNPAASTPSWAGYGRFLTPTETAAATATTPTHDLSSFAAGGGPASPSSGQPSESHQDTAPTGHEKKTKPPKQQAYVTPPTTPILDDPDRPTLQSGPPAASITTPELTTLPPDLHQSAAVSDAANRAPESFAYRWPTPATHGRILNALEALALPPLTHYIAFNNLTAAPSDPTSRSEAAAPQNSPSSRPKRVARSGKTPVFPAATPTLTNAQLLAYTFTDTTTPTYILTAESPLTTNGPVYLTLIAQPTASSAELHLTLLSITDAAHFDRTPWFRPIDAVDPDATGRADLLVELRSQTTRQFALYNLTTTPPQQTLLTIPIEYLHPTPRP